MKIKKPVYILLVLGLVLIGMFSLGNSVVQAGSCNVNWVLSNENPPLNTNIDVRVSGSDSGGWQGVSLRLDGNDIPGRPIEPGPTFPYTVNSGAAGLHTLTYVTDNGATTCSPSKTFTSASKDISGLGTTCNGNVAYPGGGGYALWNNQCNGTLQGGGTGIGQSCCELACGASSQCDEQTPGQGSCSAECQFIPPPVPPACGSPAVDSSVSPFNVAFAWGAVSGAQFYDFRLWDYNLGGWGDANWLKESIVVNDLTGTSYNGSGGKLIKNDYGSPINLTPGQNYRYRVSARNSSGIAWANCNFKTVGLCNQTGDLNGDGVTNMEDFNAWREAFTGQRGVNFTQGCNASIPANLQLFNIWRNKNFKLN